MNSNEITFTSFQSYHVPTLTKPVKKERGLLTLIFRYTLPFILLDVGAIGVALFLYFVQKVTFSFLGTAFLLYCISFILLAILHRGFGAWHSRLFTLLYILVVLFSLGLLVYVVLTRIGDIYIFGFFRAAFSIFQKLKNVIHIFDFFRAAFFIVITNFIVLPFMNIGFVVWKRFARKIEIFMPRIFPNVGRMNPRELVVRIGCSLVLLSNFGYATLIGPNALRVEEVKIVSHKVSEDVTILHISDIHIHSVGWYERKVFRCIQQLNPDIILHTGDLISVYEPEKRDRELKKLAMLFQQLTPKYGIYSVVGNHEWRLQLDWFNELAGFKTLIDENG